MQLFVQWEIASLHLQSLLCFKEITDKPLYSQLLLLMLYELQIYLSLGR